jgi:hypothetical protein
MAPTTAAIIIRTMLTPVHIITVDIIATNTCVASTGRPQATGCLGFFFRGERVASGRVVPHGSMTLTFRARARPSGSPHPPTPLPPDQKPTTEATTFTPRASKARGVLFCARPASRESRGRGAKLAALVRAQSLPQICSQLSSHMPQGGGATGTFGCYRQLLVQRANSA